MMANCVYCNSEVASNATFCPKCGSVRMTNCVYCSYEVAPNASFCPKCGSSSPTLLPSNPPEPEFTFTDFVFGTITFVGTTVGLLFGGIWGFKVGGYSGALVCGLLGGAVGYHLAGASVVLAVLSIPAIILWALWGMGKP